MAFTDLLDSISYATSTPAERAQMIANKNALLQQQQLMAQQSAISKLYGGPDPSAGNGQINWNPMQPPTGNTTLLGGSVPGQPNTQTMPNAQAAGLLGKAAPQSLLNSSPDDFDAQKLALLKQANPEAFMSQDVTMATLAPRLRAAGMSPEQINAFMLAPKEAGEAMAKTAFPTLSDYARDLVASGLKQGTPEFAAAMADKRAKETYIAEQDPLKRQEIVAHIASDNATTTYKNAQSDMLKDGGLTDDSMGRMYEQLQAGQPLNQIAGNLGRGQQGSNNLIKFQNYVTQRMQSAGFHGADLAAKNAEFSAIRSGMIANERASANIDRATREMDILGDQLTTASKDVDRVGWTDLNGLANFARSHSSQPEYGKLDVAVQGFKTAFGQALARNGVPTDQVRAKSDSLFSAVRSHADLMARVAQAKLEARGVIQATSDTGAALAGRISGNPGAATPAGTTVAPVTGIDYHSMYGLTPK